MPATETTWRDQKLLHVAFAFCGLAMLVATVWMFVADHNREWKSYQRNLRTIDEQMTEWRYQQEQAATGAERSKLEADLLVARSQAPPPELYDNFKQEVQADAERRGQAEYNFTDLDGLQTTAQTLAVSAAETPEAQERAAAARNDLVNELSQIVRRARFREDQELDKRKFDRADFDAARAQLDLAIRDGHQQMLEQLQARVTQLQNQIAEVTSNYQDVASHRLKLQSILDQITAGERAIEEALKENEAELGRLSSTLQDRHASYFVSTFPFLGKKLLEMPIVDAFNSPLKIDNLWTQNLTIENGSFGQVRRFDRCTTCHRAIDKTMPGLPDQPALVADHQLKLTLNTPDTPPARDEQTQTLKERAQELKQVYGIRLADQGLIHFDDITIDHVEPGSLAASASLRADFEDASRGEAGLRVGDVLLYVNGDKVLSKPQVLRMLLDTAPWGEPLTLTVRRGLPHPYTSHPRLDLFVGSLSPHPLPVMGCTICHDGQGSATAFKWASHTPNTPEQERDWIRQYGWFNNHHWIFPMYPQRFAQSACVKCHHELIELEPSERFPEPPAPKLLRGFNLVRQYGCFGCHEINGYQGPDQRIGPDMRLEPNYYAAAAEVKNDEGFQALRPQQQDWVRQVIDHPELDEYRNLLREFLVQDKQANPSVLSARSHAMAEVLQNVEKPGQFRKVGPSLRYVAEKLGPQFLFSWIRRPQDFRPTTRMPQIFGLWDHLEGGDLELAKRYEPVEIMGIVTYLLEKSQSWDYRTPEEGIPAAAGQDQIARGKLLVETRGCLACHQHKDFPEHQATQASDLSNLGDKLTAPGTPNGRAWLYSWLKLPSHYNARTKMPDLQLAPITDANGNTTDPAADITEYLLSSTNGWKPAPDVAQLLSGLDTESLKAVALEHLSQVFFTEDAKRYLASGIPESMRESLKGAEVELVGSFRDDEEARIRQLVYLGRMTIAKSGCFACHDIPGFEDAKPIGTALSDWGRKDPTQLAFEHIVEYLHHRDHAAGGTGGQDSHGAPPAAETPEQVGAEQADDEFDLSFYRQRLEEHDRVGFIWQKLKEPRSFDYLKAANKPYLERLRMPQFSFTDEEREAVITFVLGLVADPPAGEFVYHPAPRQRALVEGRMVLDKYNCAGCHILEAERWEIEYQPGDFRAPTVVNEFPFVRPHVPIAVRNASLAPDPLRGVLRGTVTGMLSISDNTGRPVVLDEEGDPIEAESEDQYDPATLQYRFDLWQPAILGGEVHHVGVLPLTIPASMITKKYAPWGGDVTRLLLPRVVALEKEVNPAAKGSEAWGWLPPPLVDEGQKVQPDWLHSFLLDPHLIRPSVVMRMPKFNMSSNEATKLVNYFAAKADAVFPFAFSSRLRDAHLVAAQTDYRERLPESNGVASSSSTSDGSQQRFDHAMSIVTNGNYCVQCHLIADFVPAGSERAKAPDLAEVYRRLRPDWVRRWVANPKSILPYTGMPVNIPFDPAAPHLGGVSQELYHGTSIEQLDAVVDLMMNYDRYASRRSLIAPLIKPASPAPVATSAGSQGAGSGPR